MTVVYKIGEKDLRPWGEWEVIDAGTNYIVKKICVLPHKKLSLQFHSHRNEHWIIVQGNPLITVGERVFTASQNSTIFIPVGEKHRIENQSDYSVLFIEIQTGNILDENDIIRLEDSYGRL